MTQPITDEQLDEWAKLADAATPGAWADSEVDGGCSVVISPDHWTSPSIAEVWSGQANADFIAESRSAVPALIAEIRRLREPSGMSAKDLLDQLDDVLTIYKGEDIDLKRARELVLSIFREAVRS